MKLELFHAGHYERGIGYKYFVPSKVNQQWVWETPEINTLLEKASVRLGELNSYAKLVPNIDLFIQLHVTKEAVVSSRIEGTKTNMDEALLPEEEVKPERRNDWKEVKNYIAALNAAIEQLDKLPLSSRLLRQAHKMLLSGVRGESKLPGEFRTSQNWIGGNSLADATFIPPHQQYIGELMGDLENFLHNNETRVPELIRIGIAHYQFETIHPFLDGNGRIGRLLITLYLVSKGILDQPLLYLSVFFEKNKELYYDNLTRVRTHNDLAQWLKYFLVGVEQTAAKAVDTLAQVITLKTTIEAEVRNNYGRRAYKVLAILQQLYTNPITSVEGIKQQLNVSYKTANELAGAMQNSGYLEETTGQTRNRIYKFKPYLDAFENI
jgi:Fic family protein